MRGDKSAAIECLTLAADIASAPFRKGKFPREQVEVAASQTLDALSFKEDIDVYGHVVGRIPKKRIHSLFFSKVKSILIENVTSKEFNALLLKEIRELTVTWGAENAQEEVAD
jgi:hypothetical protein